MSTIPLYPIDKEYAIQRVRELNNKALLTEKEKEIYEDSVDIILSYNAQFNRGAGKAFHMPTKRKDLKL